MEAPISFCDSAHTKKMRIKADTNEKAIFK
jgi:hypothetical protein